MIDFDYNEFCCGCGACESACPNDAVKLVSQNEGFQIPEIDRLKCTNCGKCEKVCPHLNAMKYKVKYCDDIPSYLFASSDDRAKQRSSSGAAFYELAKNTLDSGGYVAGCVWDNNFKAEHIVSDSMNDLFKMQGSKYVQSDMSKCYLKILDHLRAGRRVVFSGTPCQCAALHGIVMLPENSGLRNNLLNVALICHGVSSPRAWEGYKKYLENISGAKLKSVNFRDKSYAGYNKPYCKYEYDNGTITYLPTFLPSRLPSYTEASLVYNLSIRKSCCHCDCKGVTSCSDIVLGDWYAEYKGEGKLGTSCILAFTDAGNKAIKEMLPNVRVFSYQNVKEGNPFVEESVKLSPKREDFFINISPNIWNDIKKYYPKKYIIKKLAVALGLYDLIKKLTSLSKKH